MTARQVRFRVAGWVTTLLGAGLLLVTVAMVVAPGLRLAPAVPVGETLTVDVSAGDLAVYTDTEGRWGDLTCTDDVTGTTVGLRPDMTQQDLRVPERWYAQGSFEVTAPHTLALTCDSPVAGTRFTVGPDVSIVVLAGIALVGAVAVVTTLAGVVFLVISRRGRRTPSGLRGA